MINAVMKCQSGQQFLDIASILVEHGTVLNDTDSCNNSVLSHFIARHLCKEFKVVEASQIITFFTKNGIKNSTVLLSAMNYLYAVLPKYLNSSISLLVIFSVIVAIISTYSQDSKLNGIEKLKASLSKDNLPECLDILMTLGVNPNSADSYGNTALHYATLLPFQGVSEEYAKKILQTLEKHNVRFNIRNKDNETPLHFCLSEQAWELAIHKGTWSRGITTVVDICQFLLKDHSLISETTRRGETVYHLIMTLLQRGLSMNEEIRDHICSNALRLLELFSKAAGNQSLVLMKMDDKMNSPIHLWASLSFPPDQNYEDLVTKDCDFAKLLDTILKYLLKPGITPNQQNEDNQTPLYHCQTWTAAEILIKAGANTKDLDRENRSPLLNAAQHQTFEDTTTKFFPDVKDNPKQFFETCVSFGLDLWSSDKQGESIFSILLKSGVFALSNALVEIALDHELNQSILEQLVKTICKDESTLTKWKSLLITNILKSKAYRPSNLDDALLNCCINIKKLLDQGAKFDFEKVEGNASVHVDIVSQLRLRGAKSNEATDNLCCEFPELKTLLTSKLDAESMPMSIPWTSYSKTHETKLAEVARKQNNRSIGTYWFHEDPIGSGSFGHVFAGINEKDGMEIAIKKIEKLRMVKPEDQREIQNLTALADCPKVVRYFFFEDSDKKFVYIVLELMEGHLGDYFTRSFDASRSELLCKDVVEGLAYLHQHRPVPILHRDLKPGNILYKLHPQLCLKIADFGLSSPMNTGGTTVIGTSVGTRCWIAPDALTSIPYQHSRSSDVFSCGLLLHYILSKQKHPFSPAGATNVDDIQTPVNMRNYQMEGWNVSLAPVATHLIKDMLQQDASQRPSAADSLSHPFFWSNKKKMDFLSAVGNQNEFECPSTNKAACYHVTTGVEAHLENNFTNIVQYAKWDDPNYKHMAKVVAEMNKPIEKVNKKGATYFQNPRIYDTGSVVELVRFIRNAFNHVSEPNRPSDIRKMILEDAVFLKEFPHLLIEVYKAVITHGWNNRAEIKYAMTHEEQKP